MMRTTINIQDSLLEKAKRYSTKKGITLGAVIETALAYFLKDTEKSPNNTKFKLVTVKGELVNLELNLDKTSEILDDQDLEFYKR